jgi:hypothetical protein
MIKTLPSYARCKGILSAKEAKEFFEAWFETKDHPKAEVLFRLAWEHGHSNGVYEVAIYYNDFMELIA